MFILPVKEPVYSVAGFAKPFKNQLITVKTKLNNNAHPKFATSKPGVRKSANIIISALITNVKSPSVRIFTGRVRINKIGLIIAFIKPRTTANTTAVKKLLTETCGNKYAVTKIAKAEINQLIMIFI